MKYLVALFLFFIVACNKDIIESETPPSPESDTIEVSVDIDISVPVSNGTTNPAPPTPTPPPATSGMTCQVYDFAGKDKILTTNVKDLVHLGSFTLPEVDVTLRDWALGFPYFPSNLSYLREYYLIDCIANIQGEGKKVNMSLTSDDGSVMFINNNLRIDNDGLHSSATKSAEIKLKKGKNKIRLLWFQGPRNHLQLELKLNGNYINGLSY